MRRTRARERLKGVQVHSTQKQDVLSGQSFLTNPPNSIVESSETSHRVLTKPLCCMANSLEEWHVRCRVPHDGRLFPGIFCLVISNTHARTHVRLMVSSLVTTSQYCVIFISP